MDVQLYFDRIGYSGPRTASAEVLYNIARRHTYTIPFENLNPLLRIAVNLDLDALETKLVQSKRGGYCFEHNLLLSAALRELGFGVTELAARVLWGSAGDRVGPRSHMLLRVEAEEQSYIVDVGFGGQTLPEPIRLLPGEAQSTSHEDYRLLPVDDELELQSLVKGNWESLYRFSLHRQELADYKVTSWYLCTHPDSHFIRDLVAARLEPGTRYALRGNRLTIHHAGAPSERRVLTTASEIEDVLRSTFRIEPPQSELLSPTLARIATMDENTQSTTAGG